MQSPVQNARVSLGRYDLPTTYLGSTMLEATLPLTLPVGIYDVWVYNPSGHKSALGSAVTIKGDIAVPLVFCSP